MKRKIEFVLPAEIVAGAKKGLLVGEFNDWNIETAFPLEINSDGSMSIVIKLDDGKSYQYRYFLDGERWANDNNSTATVNAFGNVVENCLIEVPVSPKTTPRKTAAKSSNKNTNKIVQDDFTQILGITRRIENILNANQINTFAELGKCTMKQILMMLEEDSLQKKPKHYTTWAKQAKFAAAGKWDELNQFKEGLND
jgi:predicted flap endonuclease-1-like 5' DNA nuclease